MRGRSSSFLIGTALIGAVVAVPALGFAASSGATSKVVLREWALVPSPATAAAGSITFTVRNRGKTRHEFVVLRTNVAADKLPVKNGRASEKGQKGEIGNLAPGATKRLTLTLAKGKYVLICNLSGHYQAGQHAAFTLR
jgi:uncharacterized cupredoxin-like copper-binding protein